METSAVLSATDLCIGYRTGHRETRIHEHLSFGLRAGELTCLLGANGAGKSTLLRTLSASQPALGGELLLLGKPAGSYTERERSRAVGIVLTDRTQAGGLTVYELVALGRQPHTGFFGRLRAADRACIDEALQAVGMAHTARSYTAELSDGERQKVMIAKALVQECPLILLDEPTAFLDVVSRIEIMTLLHRLAVEQHRAILLSTHDVGQALVSADRLWLLSREGGLECGVTEDLILKHRMDTLFARPDICFDYDHGVYYPAVRTSRRWVVDAADPILRHWTINALNRKGYACLPPDAAGCDRLPRLYARSADCLELSGTCRPGTYASFEELLAQL